MQGIASWERVEGGGEKLKAETIENTKTRIGKTRQGEQKKRHAKQNSTRQEGGPKKVSFSQRPNASPLGLNPKP